MKVARDPLAHRIDAILEKARWRGQDVMVIMLTPTQIVALGGETYRGHKLRPGRTPAIYLKGGSRLHIPQRLSRFVQTPE